MYKFSTQIRVRYAETDKMGFVYYGNYATYYEVARVEALRALGISYRGMEANGVMLPVLENWSKFIRPARYDDLLTIEVAIKEKPDTRIKFLYDIYNEEGTLLNKGQTILVFVDMSSGKPCMIPDTLLDLLSGYFEDV